MTCGSCNKLVTTVYNVAPDKWECGFCRNQHCYDSDNSFAVISTMNFKNYYSKGGNVSTKRIEMIKSRYISPEDGRTVLMKDSLGRKTDKKAYNY